MHSQEDILKKIRNEILQKDNEVLDSYISQFSSHIDIFAVEMTKAFINWKSFDDKIKGEKDKAAVSAILYSAIALHISSMKLFISGNVIASGNAQRQVLESIAMAFLCSDKSLGILEMFMNQKYSPNKAIRDVIRQSKRLGLIRAS